MLFCMEYLKFALRLIWKKFSIRFYIENKEIFLTTLYGKPKPHKKVIFKALLRLLYSVVIRSLEMYSNTYHVILVYMNLAFNIHIVVI